MARQWAVLSPCAMQRWWQTPIYQIDQYLYKNPFIYFLYIIYIYICFFFQFLLFEMLFVSCFLETSTSTYNFWVVNPIKKTLKVFGIHPPWLHASPRPPYAVSTVAARSEMQRCKQSGMNIFFTIYICIYSTHEEEELWLSYCQKPKVQLYYLFTHGYWWLCVFWIENTWNAAAFASCDETKAAFTGSSVHSPN